MKKIVFFVIGFMLIASSTAEESTPVSTYNCIPDYSTGYTIGGNGKWGPTQFDVKNQKYILKRKDSEWVWLEFGEDEAEKLPDFFGPKKCGLFNELGFLHCTNYGELIRFNKHSLRFQLVYPVGYVVTGSVVTSGEKRHDTPHIKIGTCSLL
ncbi:hypothetical protein [Candidatus Nitrotoga sp. M5]|uniref:hypothetical protein n=1 Tax=Candidatus Nitrotoga sp. M5 TaxID=2890409 RepID=UPI001EF268DF|nr:hypothetical protein [Candidatus Nitrotoga sp. M5]CAH1385364.1 exported hypothetical protein [Candidatus Nitrotoga sp. M5]